MFGTKLAPSLRAGFSSFTSFIFPSADFLITITFLGLGASAGEGAGACTGEETEARASTTGFPSSTGF